MEELPLSDLRIVSFEQFGAAPYATMFLAAFGAEILKVECGDGDFARRIGPMTLGENDSLYFQSLNLGKKSVIIDLNNAEDRSFFHDLIRTSHAVVNNLRGSQPAKLGLDYAALSAINPKIVCGHISAYGRDNSRAGWPGYDFLMQAECGIMSMTGEPGTPPARAGVSFIDYMTGTTLAFGLVCAIRAAENTGRGADVDASLFDTAIHQLSYQGTWYLNEGLVTSRVSRSSHPANAPVQLFKTADGWLYVACMTDRFWQLLCQLIDRSDLLHHPKFADRAKRFANREELTRALDEVFSTRRTGAWVDHFGSRIPIAPVRSLDEALSNPFLLEESEMIREVPHSARGKIRVFANPLRLNGQRLRQQPGPALGDHTEVVKSQIHRLLHSESEGI